MRLLVVIFSFLPGFLFADDIPLRSQVTAVTLFPNGATLTREASFDMPAGQHSLVLLDLPENTPIQSLRVSIDGANLGSINTRKDFVPARDAQESDAYIAAKALVNTLVDQLRSKEQEIETILLDVEASKARVGFLTQIGNSDDLGGLDIGALQALTSLIGEETRAALKTAQDAKIKADEAERGLTDLRNEIDQARQNLAALVPEAPDRDLLSISTSSDAPTQAVLTLEYTIWDAGWAPVYDLKLDRDAKSVAIDRGAFVFQNSGENWKDVDITLSTHQPSGQIAPSDVQSHLHRIYDPKDITPKNLARAQLSLEAIADAETASVGSLQTAQANFDGLSVSYHYPEFLDIATGADRLRVSLGQVVWDADLVLRATPLFDAQAFLMARVENNSDEIFLPGQAFIYRDGGFVGQYPMGLLPAGAKRDLTFGAVDGVRLQRRVVNRQEGDRGILVQSNDLNEELEIKVENLTDHNWTVELIDRIPYSEQEDLEIKFRAKPNPTQNNWQVRRGVLMWRFDMIPASEKIIEVSYDMKWPEDMRLR